MRPRIWWPSAGAGPVKLRSGFGRRNYNKRRLQFKRRSVTWIGGYNIEWAPRYSSCVFQLSLSDKMATAANTANAAPPSPSRPSLQGSHSSSSINSAQSNGKPADYVYFERTTAGFSDDAVPRAKTAQLKLEHFYKVAVDAAIERNTRCALTASRKRFIRC